MKNKKLTDKELKNGLNLLFTSISKKASKEDKKSPVFKYISKQIKYIKDPNEFDVMALYPIRRIIKTFISTQFKEDNYLAESIYTDYNFFESNLSELCSQFYGIGCSVDKARFLIRCAIKWKETGVMPKFDWKQKYTFHYPKTGTMKQWMNFIEGLNRLRYGYNKEYLLALNSLMLEHNKKIKNGKNKKEKENKRNSIRNGKKQ